MSRTKVLPIYFSLTGFTPFHSITCANNNQYPLNSEKEINSRIFCELQSHRGYILKQWWCLPTYLLWMTYVAITMLISSRRYKWKVKMKKYLQNEKKLYNAPINLFYLRLFIRHLLLSIIKEKRIHAIKPSTHAS